MYLQHIAKVEVIDRVDLQLTSKNEQKYLLPYGGSTKKAQCLKLRPVFHKTQD